MNFAGLDHVNIPSDSRSGLEESDGVSLKLATISSHHPFQGGMDDSYDGVDWALIELPNPSYHYMNGIIARQQENFQKVPHLLFSKEFQEVPPVGVVYIPTKSGLVKGFGTGSACSIKLPYSDVYRKVWTVEVERRLGKFYSLSTTNS